ncbi:XK-related protein 8-like isoform X1 [Polyodon spathula]|uniref:XK-related protein 8-like isoform X1 n=1 Tax=Polyodon spathula TaxID=7913 RepID=UPI001B7F168D|nr:XK-related protein 8-like isoform X1 [Polyodon spathula]
MDSGNSCDYSWVDLVFTVLGVCTFLFDLGADLWVAAEFYLYGDYFWFGIVLSFVFVSSALLQMFSWFWYKYDTKLENFNPQTTTETLLLANNDNGGRCDRLKLVHVFQLGFLLRYVTAIEQGFHVWWKKRNEPGHAIYLTHDLSMLRLFEAFSESTPQLTLMLYIIIHNNKAETFQCVSIAACFISIAWMVLEYHRSLRAFLPEKNKLGYSSSVVYFLWNLLLIAPRVGAVALFTSIFPPYIGLHFLLLWAALLLWAWAQHTDFMESGPGEWLYRTMVALIWYFSWFNVAEGGTMGRSLIYHTFMAADSGILLGTWYWYRDPLVTDHYVLPLLLALLASYLLGLLLKVTYYKLFHPKIWQPVFRAGEDVPDNLVYRSLSPTDALPSVINKRMGALANSFYFSSSMPAGGKTNGNERNATL